MTKKSRQKNRNTSKENSNIETPSKERLQITAFFIRHLIQYSINTHAQSLLLYDCIPSFILREYQLLKHQTKIHTTKMTKMKENHPILIPRLIRKRTIFLNSESKEAYKYINKISNHYLIKQIQNPFFPNTYIKKTKSRSRWLFHKNTQGAYTCVYIHTHTHIYPHICQRSFKIS